MDAIRRGSRNHPRKGRHRTRRPRNHHHHRPPHPTERPRRRSTKNSAKSSACPATPTRLATPGTNFPKPTAASPPTSRAPPWSSKTAAVPCSPSSAAAMPTNPASTAPKTTRDFRQLGSIFKPFVYLAAFDKGLRPDSHDQRRPDPARRDHGRPQLAPPQLGRQVRRHATRFLRPHPLAQHHVGPRRQPCRHPESPETSPSWPDSAPRCRETPTSFLGSWEAPPWEVATAYTIFPNDGVRYRPYLISEIKDRDGNVLLLDPAAFLSGGQAADRRGRFPTSSPKSPPAAPPPR